MSSRPLACWTLARRARPARRRDSELPFAVDHLVEAGSGRCGLGGIERTGEAGGDEPARAMAGDEHFGRARAAAGPAHAADGHGDDLAARTRPRSPEPRPTGISGPSSGRRPGRRLPSAWPRRCRRRLEPAAAPRHVHRSCRVCLSPVERSLHRRERRLSSGELPLDHLEVSPRRPLTPTAADIS